METVTKGWKFRTGEMSYKEFQRMSSTSKANYVENIEKLPSTERSNTDIIILNQYSKNYNKSNNFFSLENLD
jgi:hypothetical protein